MDGKRTLFRIVAELHLRGIEAGFTIYEVADGGVFDDHFGPEGVARETKKESTLIGGDFNDDIGPAGKNVFSVEDLMVGQSVGDDLI